MLSTGYGLTIFTAGHGPKRFRRAAEIARAAEAAGFSTVWVSELYNRSATVPMAALAAATERIRIGSNIAYGAGRSPMILAAEARDLDELSGGRLVLGLGNGTSGMMRIATPPPIQDPLPIWTAGVTHGPSRRPGRGRARRASDDDRGLCRAGAAPGARPRRRGSGPGHPRRGVRHPDLRARRGRGDRAPTGRFAIAQYAAARVYDRLFALHGWSKAQATIRAAAKARDGAAMAAAVTDEMVDAMAIACRPEDLTRQAAKHAEPFDHLNLTAAPWGLEPEDLERATRQIVACLIPAPRLIEEDQPCPPRRSAWSDRGTA